MSEIERRAREIFNLPADEDSAIAQLVTIKARLGIDQEHFEARLRLLEAIGIKTHAFPELWIKVFTDVAQWYRRIEERLQTESKVVIRGDESLELVELWSVAMGHGWSEKATGYYEDPRREGTVTKTSCKLMGVTVEKMEKKSEQ